MKGTIQEARSIAKAAGLKTFGTEFPCRYDHIGGRYVSNAHCIECETVKKAVYYSENRDAVLNKVREYAKINRESIRKRKRDHYEANKDVAAARMRDYYERNREPILAYHRELRSANAERISDARRLRYENNRESLLEYHADYREQNREHLAQNQRKYYARNTADIRAYASKARARKSLRIVDWGVEHSAETAREEARLHLLAKKLEEFTGDSYHVDHMIPLQGKLVCGLHVWNNLQVIQKRLNNAKKNKFVLTESHEWILAYGNEKLLKESDDIRMAVKWYKSMGWSFKDEGYTSGPYAVQTLTEDR